MNASAQGTLPIIGISPRNPYYSNKDNIAFGLAHLLGRYGRAFVMVPDRPDMHNYLAFGYDEEHAARKANEAGKLLKKAVREVCRRANYSLEEGFSSQGRPQSQAEAQAEAQVILIDWGQDIDQKAPFVSSLQEMRARYVANTRFRDDVDVASAHVFETRLHNHLKDNPDAQRLMETVDKRCAVKEAANYLIKELSFLDAAPSLFGGSKVDYFYHDHWAVYEKLIDGVYGPARPTHLGFQILNAESGL